MSIAGRRIPGIAVAGFALLFIVGVGTLLPVMSKTRSHEVTLVARGMAFYLENDLQTPNPTIEVKAGERVRIVLRNQERGITHDVAVPAIGVAAATAGWNQTTDVAFDAPETPGTYEYVCQPHQAMMRGTLRVTR